MNLLEIKSLYKKNGSDYFTNQYYETVIAFNEEKTEITGSYFGPHSNFREKRSLTENECLAIEIVHQSYCQLKCNFCFIDRKNDKKENMFTHLDEVKHIIDQASAKSTNSEMQLFSQIVFIGGEPTLHKDLDKMIDYSIMKGLTPILVTNGMKFHEYEYCERICRPELNIVIRMPLKSSQGEAYLDRITGVKGYNSKLSIGLRNLIHVRESKFHSMRLVGDFVLTNESIPFVLDTYISCREENIEPFFERMRVCDDHESNLNLIPSPEVVETLIKKIYDYDKKHNYIKDDNPVKIAKYYLPPALNNPCTMVQNSLHIKFNDNGFGEAISCSGQDIVHGNIKNNNIKEILEVKKKATIFSKQDMLIQGPCSKCEFYDLLNCHGGCRGNANNSYACPRASDPQCLFIRKEIRDDIKIMAPSNCSECEIEVCARKTNISKTR